MIRRALRFHLWLDALSERTKIVGLLAVIAIGLTLVGGVFALVGARDDESAAVRGAYDYGVGLADPRPAGDSTPSQPASEQQLPWPASAARWANAMTYAVRTFDDAVRVRDRAAVQAWIANLAACSLKMPPDPGSPTLEDALAPGLGPTEHVMAEVVYGHIERLCANYELAAEHLAEGFDPANVYSSETRVNVGFQYLHGSDSMMELVIGELDRE